MTNLMTQISKFMKIFAVVAQMFQADWRTDKQAGITKLKVACRYFANEPKEVV